MEATSICNGCVHTEIERSSTIVDDGNATLGQPRIRRGDCMLKWNHMIQLSGISLASVLTLSGAGYTTVAYAENTRDRHADLMGAAITFDQMWFVTTIPATIATVLLFNFFWL